MRTTGLLFILYLNLVSCDEVTLLDKAMKTVRYCTAINNRTLDSDYLVGTWYALYKFAIMLNLVGDSYCPTTTFTRPTKEQLDGYKAKYNIANETFSFDDGPLLVSTIKEPNGAIVVGTKTAKYYFLKPTSVMRLSGMYEVLTYKPVSNDYLIHYNCNSRGHVKWLWSRRNNQTDKEIDDVVKDIYEVADKETQRFCVKRKVQTTTEYF